MWRRLFTAMAFGWNDNDVNFFQRRASWCKAWRSSGRCAQLTRWRLSGPHCLWSRCSPSSLDTLSTCLSVVSITSYTRETEKQSYTYVRICPASWLNTFRSRRAYFTYTIFVRTIAHHPNRVGKRQMMMFVGPSKYSSCNLVVGFLFSIQISYSYFTSLNSLRIRLYYYLGSTLLIILR